MEIKRYIQKEVEDALQRQAAVVIIGPRQIGKTTLAMNIAKHTQAEYLDLENRSDRARLENPDLFFDRNEDKLVILDEIHRKPDLFETLRGVIDEGRRKKKGKGRFLILGSASLELIKQSSETLAGRVTYINMTPFTLYELPQNNKSLDKLWLRGGFPESYLAKTEKESLAYRRDFIRTYLERDIPLFGPRVPAETMERLWTMLAHLQGTLLNASSLARSLQMSAQSVTRYIDLLVDLLLVRRLQPYHINTRKRLIKSPKIYVRDTGLLHALLNIETHNQLAGHPIIGNSWESFCIETLLPHLPWRSQAYFYRTARGAEIDLVIEHGDQKVWAIEMKNSQAPKLNPGFYEACEHIKPHKSFIVCPHIKSYPLTQDIEVLSLHDMMKKLQNY